jgi:hypothetical protein
VDANGQDLKQQQYVKEIINRSKMWLEKAVSVHRLSKNLVLSPEFKCSEEVPTVAASGKHSASVLYCVY